MQAVTGAMTTLLPKLADLLIGEYNLQKSVRGEILFLKAELERMDAALLQLSEAPIDEPPDKLTKLWQRDVRELSYDVEDSIDRFIVHIETRNPSKPHSFMAFIDRSLSLLTRAKIRHKIGTSIKEIKIRVKEISERHDRYKNERGVAKHVGTPINNIRILALYKKETDLVAIEERSNDLKTRLFEGDEASKQQLKIVSIAGFGGVGKTTIANVVYRKLIGDFDCGAFVSVSLNPNIAMIFKDMLHMLDKEQYRGIYEQTLGVQQLMDKIREHLQDRKYFVVVDDIWSISDWEIIQCALIQNACGSKIITTTRSLDVAKQVGGVYRLEPLSLIDSRKLFYQRIFGDEDKCPNHLAKISTDILRKCAGVPLAIITIASVLTSRNEKENAQNYWSKVYQSMGSGLADSTEVQDMRKILSVSYYDLPPHLKTCLLYFSLFPEDYKISTKDLIWKWIGEGFVNKQQGKTLYEVGEIYVEQLVNRSMIQAVDFDRDSKTVSCSVHDMVFDLISSLSNEEQFLTKLSHHQYPMSLPNKVRRLSIQASQQEDVEQLATMSFSFSHVRSLTVFGLMPTLATFVVLRVLDLSYCKEVKNEHCKNICNMFHLRYLSLRDTSITNIPAEISNLKVLQVLDISENFIQEMPSTIIHLQQLLHLHVDRIRLPDGFGLLKSLQEVEGSVNIDSPSMLHDLGKLTELNGTLTLTFFEWDESYVKPFIQCLSNMVNLKSLYIEGEISSLDSGCDSLSPGPQHLCSIYMPKTCGIRATPKWMPSLCLLSCLHITLFTLTEQDLQVLGIIPSLSYLSVIVMQTTQDRLERLVVGNSCPFERLMELDLKFRGSMVVVFASGAMQRLKTLRLKLGAKETMHQFGDFDVGMEHLSSLELLNVQFDRDDPHEEREAVGDAIRKSLERNLNKPTLELEGIVLLKIRLHCDGCADRIKRRISKIKGVKDVAFNLEKDEVQVMGTMDVPAMLPELREKLNRDVELAEPGTIYEANQTPSAAVSLTDPIGPGDDREESCDII